MNIDNVAQAYYDRIANKYYEGGDKTQDEIEEEAVQIALATRDVRNGRPDGTDLLVEAIVEAPDYWLKELCDAIRNGEDAEEIGEKLIHRIRRYAYACATFNGWV